MSKKIFAEFLGTFTLIFLGAGGIVSGKADLQGVALAHGLAIFVMVSALAGISGAHFNPAVSAAMLVTKRINIQEFLYFVLAQLSGAAVASLALNYIYGSANGYGLPAIANGTSTVAGASAELIGTALLALVIFGVAVDKRSVAASLPGLPIGLTISAVILSVGPITGAALNPARWFGPALLSGDWSNSWIYIVAPIAGAVIAGLSYQAIAKPE
ncbi:MAG: MIP/aquaporin family protein [Candidatus Nanopelagicaceae bacterium]